MFKNVVSTIYIAHYLNKRRIKAIANSQKHNRLDASFGFYRLNAILLSRWIKPVCFIKLLKEFSSRLWISTNNQQHKLWTINLHQACWQSAADLLFSSQSKWCNSEMGLMTATRQQHSQEWATERRLASLRLANTKSAASCEQAWCKSIVTTFRLDAICIKSAKYTTRIKSVFFSGCEFCNSLAATCAFLAL